MKTKEWVKRWRSWIAPRPTLPGVWCRRDGGFLARGRVVDPRTGKMKEVRLTLLETEDAGLAFEALHKELRKVRAGEAAESPGRIRFSDFAVSLVERKIAAGDIRSRKGKEKWGSILELHLLPAFGDYFMDRLRRAEVEAWRARVAAEIQAGSYAPTYANTWLATLKVITKAAAAELELDRDAAAGVKSFDTSEHHTYTEEEPNSLLPEEVPVFLAHMMGLQPQHFAITSLGVATGLRPSSLRPLRRKGPTPDVLWSEKAILVRRSHTRGQDVLERTKTKIRQRIALPDELMEILRWHVEALPEGPMRDSDLLFPSVTGGFRSPSGLDKPFFEVAKAMGLKKHITPRAMRRTFQDLARAAEVNDVVTRAISGHATDTMQRHYSTVNPGEIRDGLARVISLAGFKEAMGERATGSGGVQGGVQQAENENGR